MNNFTNSDMAEIFPIIILFILYLFFSNFKFSKKVAIFSIISQKTSILPQKLLKCEQ